uniref:Thiol-disulfide isomerase or thioredoxin n=1 Tax=uncultured Thiotrichaceae bacterium TaxID=298394 RepID=A0A6S6U5B3_9GAMM|nr:MAG: Thiol-disulfide isomerase or thioredoxin [uncultured Thiotrichaceae bacterium]
MTSTGSTARQSGFSAWNVLASILLFAVGVGFAIYNKADKISPLELVTLNGNQVNLPGEGLSWVNLWSINCPPCLKEMPYLEAVHKQYEGEVQVVAVSVPYDPPNVIKEYQTREGFTLPMALDLEGIAVRAFTDTLVVPSHYLVDAKGNVLLSHLGEIDEKSIRTAIDKHL